MGWLGTYSHRRKFKLDRFMQTDNILALHINSSSGLTNVDLTDLFTVMPLSAIKKYAITRNDGTTQLSGEVSNYDVGNQKGSIITSFPTDAIEGYLYYDQTQPDNPNVGEPGDVASQTIYSSSILRACHFSENPAGSAPQIIDSTSNNNNGTVQGSIPAGNLVDGVVGKALRFNNFNHSVEYIGTQNEHLDSTHTISVFVKYDNLTDVGFPVYPIIYMKHNPGTPNGWLIVVNNTDFVEYWINATTSMLVSNVESGDNQFHEITVRLDQSNNLQDIFIDGNIVVTKSPSSITTNTENHRLCIFNTDEGRSIDITEMYVHDVARTNTYIKDHYDSMTDNIVTWENEELIPPIPKLRNDKATSKTQEILAFKVTIHKTDGKKESIKFDDRWENQLNGI